VVAGLVPSPSDDHATPDEFQAVRQDLRTADRLDRRVSNLLDMSRLRAGAVQLASRPVYLEDVVAGVLGSVERAPANTLDDTPGGGLTVLIDLPLAR
jgi:K+-sensing histidine kinase KdpD